MGAGDVQARLACMRHRAAERTDKQDAAHANGGNGFEYAIREGGPTQVRLFTHKEDKIRRFVNEKPGRRHLDALDEAVLNLDSRSEQSGQLHRTGEIVQVKGIWIDLGKKAGL